MFFQAGMVIQRALPRIALIALLPLSFSMAAQETRPDLSGRITAESGEPLPGATVFIYTAGPREGAGILCPSCYPDCVKRARTDAEGNFTIESLDPALIFRVLVAAPGYKARFVEKVDPAEKPLETALQKSAEPDSPRKRVRGKIVNAEGEPVEGAVVNIRGVTRGDGTRFGGNSDVDPLAVTDHAGQFVIHGAEEFDSVSVDVEARALAKRVFQRLSTGEELHTLTLDEGASVTGRVLHQGKPLSGAEVGIAGADRSADIFVGYYTVATDEDGRFLFVNLPADTAWQFYGMMNSLGAKGTIPARTVKTQGVGSTLDLGDITLEQGHLVAGQVRLADGSPLPENTRIFLGREGTWDTQQIELEKGGHFRLIGVPREPVSISARVKGYRLSLNNANLDPFNPFHLVGTVYGDKTDLLIELEPGEPHRRLEGNGNILRQESLRGAEPPESSGDIKITGTVIDSATGKPLPSFTVKEGRAAQYGPDFDWFHTRKHDFSNGEFTLFFRQLPQAPAILVEAGDYIPAPVGPITTAETNLVIKLQQGRGPTGTLVDSNGEPLPDVTVYLTTMRDGVYVSNDLKVREQAYQGTKKAQTDEHGRFSFEPQVDAYAVIVLADQGYAERTLADLQTDNQLRLQPWARVEGQLLIGSKPVASEIVRLGLAHVPYAYHPRNFPPISLFLNTTTDAEGRFVFERVPPIPVEVSHQPNVRDSQMGTIPISQNQKLQLEPGQTHKVNLGGQGRPVIGRMVVNGYDKPIHWRADVHSITKVLPQPADFPSFDSAMSEFREAMATAETDHEKRLLQEQIRERQNEYQQKMRDFYRTEAGREHHFQNRRYALNFAQDGSFRIEDVPGGKYQLHMELREGASEGHSRFSAPVIATLQKEIDVPETPDGHSHEPHDLGAIELAARNVMSAGKTAPDFEVRTLDDKSIKLSDFRGKFVLLDFWAVWCGPCVAETPFLKETYNTFKDDPRFAMIGLSLDPKEKAPRDYAEKNELGWIQAFLGEWSKTDLPNQYGVDGIPSIMLIDPHGKIIATNLRGPAIQSAVRTALVK